MVKEVVLKDTSSVLRLNNVACEEGMDILVSCGNIMVDARSLLALFTLVGSRVNLVAPDCENPVKFVKVVDKMCL